MLSNFKVTLSNENRLKTFITSACAYGPSSMLPSTFNMFILTTDIIYV